ncbi:phospho-sugar mutase [Brevibacillus fulvus]|uniref:Phosphoglucomutase n=1 Tax=Brevibacillus fulvus TaxID=1125967 RepID=A0A938Y1M6_9BACL|nr:phospho-sugar mutase [Brevibacillus fulvus]MBM7591523.1 phosphoglucomutase [Brevibacillus fulvus]
MDAHLTAYQRWASFEQIDPDLKAELRTITDEREIEDRFYRHLEFGTAGMRGIIGAGTNRMNLYTVRRATEGLARYIRSQNKREKGVVIAYDSRHMSRQFAEAACGVLAAHGIKSWLFAELRPTPMLSFAVRHLHAAAGIMITASHNPPAYNGYKVYGEDGGQISSSTAAQILQQIAAVEDELRVPFLSYAEGENQGLIEQLGEEIDQVYVKQVLSLSRNPEKVRQMADHMQIVYTPLHGTGNKPVRRVLAELGFSQVAVVPEQELPDPNFSTVTSPNPEEHQAFVMALELARQSNADLVLGTDPDADRVGMVVRTAQGDYQILNGNQTGALLLAYLLEHAAATGSLPENGVILKTIVTSDLGRAIAASYGVETVETLTGFKYIAEKIANYEQTGERQFLFGYEESYGYLIGTFVRDKDAVQAALLLCEMAAYYKSKGKRLDQVLQALYQQFGYFVDDLLSFTFKGKEGQQQMAKLMTRLRQEPLTRIAGYPVVSVLDYAQGRDGLPPSDVLKFILEDGSWLAIRPSGTEPKIKFYLSSLAQEEDRAHEKLQQMKRFALELVE